MMKWRFQLIFMNTSTKLERFNQFFQNENVERVGSVFYVTQTPYRWNSNWTAFKNDNNYVCFYWYNCISITFQEKQMQNMIFIFPVSCGVVGWEMICVQTCTKRVDWYNLWYLNQFRTIFKWMNQWKKVIDDAQCSLVICDWQINLYFQNGFCTSIQWFLFIRKINSNKRNKQLAFFPVINSSKSWMITSFGGWFWVIPLPQRTVPRELTCKVQNFFMVEIFLNIA